MKPVSPRTGAPEFTLAEDQDEYQNLIVARYRDVLLTRWRFTEEERESIANGEDLYVGICTYGAPMQPIHVQVGDEGWEAEDAD